MQTIISICKTQCIAKPNVPEMQKPNRVNVTAAKALEEASPRLPGDIDSSILWS